MKAMKNYNESENFCCICFTEQVNFYSLWFVACNSYEESEPVKVRGIIDIVLHNAWITVDKIHETTL